MAKAGPNEFFTEYDEEKVGNPPLRVKRGSHKFGFRDGYGGQASVRKVGNHIHLSAVEAGKWPEENQRADVLFPDIETFVAFCGTAIQHMTAEERPRELAVALREWATAQAEEKADAPTVKFRRGQIIACGGQVSEWGRLSPAEKAQWRARREAAERDLK